MNIEITDQVTPVLVRLQGELSDPTAVHDEIATAVEKLVTDNLLARTRKPNRLGATSTGFWGRVRDSVIAKADASGATILIPERVVNPKWSSGWSNTRPSTCRPGRRDSQEGYGAMHDLFNTPGDVQIDKTADGRIFWNREREAPESCDDLQYDYREEAGSLFSRSREAFEVTRSGDWGTAIPQALQESIESRWGAESTAAALGRKPLFHEDLGDSGVASQVAESSNPLLPIQGN